MIGRRDLPDHFRQWNERWGAPFGRPLPAVVDSIVRSPVGRRSPLHRPVEVLERRRGPFAAQPNNSTRSWEYPWAYHAAPPRPGQRIVELGGALSGLQITLAAGGAEVINVDPFVDYGNTGEYGQLDPAAALSRLAGRFGTRVELRRCPIEEAGLAAGGIDTVFCISTIEHLDDDTRRRALAEVQRVLRPGGRCVLTIDLFLDLAPFTRRAANRFGTNVDVAALVADSGLELAEGRPAELCGFPEFDAASVQADLAGLLIGDYPALAQCLVLRKGPA